MNRSAEFATIVRDGRRIRSGCIVLHSGVLPDTDRQPRVGLVVGRSVGGSVDRHRVSRRLRAQLADRLDLLPPGSGTVIRALPTARSASFAALGADLDTALARLGEPR